MDVRLGDTLVMKKAHPCGSKEWKVLRTGMDFRLKAWAAATRSWAPAPSWKGILRRSAMQRNEPLGQAKALLYEHFGYSSFRGAQETLISAILSGKDALGIMPTGAGKSICYQIPGLMLRESRWWCRR